MGKVKGKITNWKQYNHALTQRGSLTFWIDNTAIKQWYNKTPTGRRGRSNTYSDSAISTALMIKGVFKLPLRALEGFINSVFRLMDVDIQSPGYTCISKRAKTVDVDYRLPSRGPIRHVVIDATGLKVFGEGEWKVHKHGKEKRREWRKSHFAVDADSHHERSLSETAVYRYKQLLSEKLSFRNYNAQVGEIMAGVAVLNKMLRLGMPVRQTTE